METPTPDPEIAALLAPPRRRWGRIVAALFAAGGLTAAACAGLAWRLWPAALTYETLEVTRGDLVATVEATGTLDAEETVQVGAEVSGRVAELAVDYNDAVKAGELLARIDPEQLTASVDQSKAQLEAALASLAEAKASAAEATSALERAETEAGRGLVSSATLETRRATAARSAASVRSANANAAVARANLAAAEDKLDKSVIVAPIDGFVLARYVSLGQTVTAGFSTPVMFDLARDLARMRLVVDVDEADVGRVVDGQLATFAVDAWPGESFGSTVTQLRFAPTTTSNVVTYEAVLSVDNPEHRLRPGMTATATIVVAERKGAVLVPTEALRFVPEGELPSPEPRVWRLDGGAPVAVAVEVGLADESRTEILAGLAPGDVVIVDASATK